MKSNKKSKTNVYRDSLEFKLKEINSSLRETYLLENNVGVLEGLAGIALFQFYYSKYTNNDIYADWGKESLIRIMNIINQGYSLPTYSTGLAGAGWTLSFLSNKGFIETNTDELLFDLDSYLLDVMKQDINNGYYDFLHGAMGYAFYFLERYKTTQNKELRLSYKINIKNFIEGISYLAKEDINGIKWLSKINLDKNQINGYNLSLSHGISSIISFLSELVELNLFIGECTNLLYKASSYIYKQRLNSKQKHISLFPNWVLENGKPDQNSRLAWCYGDFGIGLALLKASKVLNDEILREKALFILENTTNRKTFKETLVRDAAICHGSFGNAQIYSYLYHETKNELFKDSSTYWIKHGMRLSIYEDGYAGFKQWVSNLDEWSPRSPLLIGISGIGLSIIDYLSPQRNNWDKCLLIG